MFEKCVCGENAWPVQLPGEYIVYLCFDCVNEWHKFIRVVPTLKKYFMADRLLDRAVNTATNDLESLMTRKLVLQDELYEIAKAWVEERRKGKVDKKVCLDILDRAL